MTNLIELRDSQLSRKQDNLDTFELLETAAVDRAKKSFQNATEAAYYIHIILKHRLWRHRQDEDGNPLYFKQNDYLKELEAKVGWGRSSIFEYDGAWKFGENLGFKTIEEVNAIGGIHILKIAKEYVQQAAKIDSKGRIVEYHNPSKPPELSNEEYLREKVIQLSPMNGDALRPVQLREEMYIHFSGRPKIEFQLERIEGLGGYDIRWLVKTVDPETKMISAETGLLSEGAPEVVMIFICYKLFMKRETLSEDEG